MRGSLRRAAGVLGKQIVNACRWQAHLYKHDGHSGHGLGPGRSPPGSSGSDGQQYCAGS